MCVMSAIVFAINSAGQTPKWDPFLYFSNRVSNTVWVIEAKWGIYASVKLPIISSENGWRLFGANPPVGAGTSVLGWGVE